VLSWLVALAIGSTLWFELEPGVSGRFPSARFRDTKES
jgi:hypothetical protein